MPKGELLVLVPMVIVANLVATLPCLWGGFVSLRALVLVLAWAVYCLIVSGIELAVCSLIEPGAPDRDAFSILYALNVSQAATVFAVVRIYRALGYRLQQVPRRAAPPPDDTASQHAAETSSPQDSADAD
jgi:hypothetical protein